VLKTFSLEICMSMRKRKMYHSHFKALQVPALGEVVGNYDTKRPDPDVSNSDVKKALICIVLTELLYIYTSFTKKEGGLGSLHNLHILCRFLLLFVTISHLLC